MSYRLFVPAQAVGANLVYFDLFNASGSTQTVSILSVMPIVSGATAVTGTLGVDVFLTRTTAIGTGGTAATAEGTSLTAMTITCMDGTQSIPNGVTARLTPTGGATEGAVLSGRSVFTEETNAGTYTPQPDMVRGWNAENIKGVIVPENSGIRVVQSSVASVGNIGFDVIFNCITR